MYIVLTECIYFLGHLDIMYIFLVIVNSFLLRLTYQVSFYSFDSPQKYQVLI